MALPVRVIDAHHHYWARPGMDYVVTDLAADVTTVPQVIATVYAECDAWYRPDGPEHLRAVGETEWVATNDTALVAGIVGYADLRAGAHVEEVLSAHVLAGLGRFCGVRQRAVWDSHPAIRPGLPFTGPGLLLDADFQRGVRVLARMGLSFDAWVYFPQLPEVAALARAVPEATIVLNHLGGPIVMGPYTDRDLVLAAWRPLLAELAGCPNVVVKLGGIGMPIYGQDWHKRAQQPAADEVAAVWGEPIRWCIDAFGPERCMFESNFPVDRLSMSYTTIWQVFDHTSASYDDAERQELFHDTAQRVYRLQV
ncbi:MAG: amidohydrolase family protein [Actinomycetota bacterium]|nr:amidohydrolase family protein [Actinomycetota bacterium]